MKRRTQSKSTAILSVAILAATVGTGCMGLLGDLLGAILGIDLLGVVPASDFNRTGNLNLSLLPKDGQGGIMLGSLSQSGLDVSVEDDDGSVEECDFVDEDTVVASRFNSLALVLDSSGSMERTYPEEEYGDLCTTCPHDPNRLRIEAAADLIQIVRSDSPDSRIGVMDFGPDPSSGMSDTRIIEDFGTNTQGLLSALDEIGGSEMAGTPMWDSLAEIILALDDDADEYEDVLRSTGALTGLNPQPVPDDQVPDFGDDDDETDDETETPAPQNPPLDESGVRRLIVVISDGQDLDSDSYDLESVIALAQQHDITVHAIGLGPASAQFEDPRALTLADAVTDLQRLAEGTGGYYASVHDAAALESLYANIATSLTQGYATTTYSCRPDDVPPQAQAFTSGQRVNGYVSLGSGMRIPWSVIAP